MRVILILILLFAFWIRCGYGESDSPTERDSPSERESPSLYVGHTEREINIQLPESARDITKDSIDLFTKRIKKRFHVWLQNSQKYIAMIKEIFNAHGLPEDLAYLPLIESGFSHYSVSPAGAVGLWQFMEGTAKRYGLRIDEYVDERRDPHKSTIAAARYLSNLYDIFASWSLVLAAYNAGEGRIARLAYKAKFNAPVRYAALARIVESANIAPDNAIENFYRSKYAPDETKRYVPLFVAATKIARDPESYGFEIKEESPSPSLSVGLWDLSIEYEEVTVKKATNLYTIAKKYKIKVSVLTKLNPALLTDTVPKGYSVRVPKPSISNYTNTAMPPSPKVDS
jgi:membrane-bound lytic murein transglycosylase D